MALQAIVDFQVSPFEVGVFALSGVIFAGFALLLLPRGICLRVGRSLGLGGARGKGARWQGLSASELADLDEEDDGGSDVGGTAPDAMRLQVHLHAEGDGEVHDFEEVELEMGGLRTVGDVKEAVAESYADKVDLSEEELVAKMVVQCMDEESMFLVALPARTPLQQLSTVQRLIVSLKPSGLSAASGALSMRDSGLECSLGSLAQRKAQLMMKTGTARGSAGAQAGGGGDASNGPVKLAALPKRIKRSIEASRSSNSAESEFERRMEQCRQQAEGGGSSHARGSGAGGGRGGRACGVVKCGCRCDTTGSSRGGGGQWKGGLPQVRRHRPRALGKGCALVP